MHSGFADWYRAVCIEPKPDELQRRWKGVETYARGASVHDVLDAARLFFGLSVKDTTFPDRLRAPFKEADEAFRMQNNDAELRVLAGAVLAQLAQHGDEWGPFAALATVCIHCQGLRQAPVLGIVEDSRRCLVRRSASLRGTDVQAAISSKLEISSQIEEVENACKTNQASQLTGPLCGVLRNVESVLKEVIKWSSFLVSELELRQEESDVLWWLYGEGSRDLDQPFNELKSPAGCLIGAKELADLTRRFPGPFAARAFLDRMLHTAHPDLKQPVSIADAVNACPAEWRREFVASPMAADGRADDCCPIHMAVRKCAEVEGKKSWLSHFHSGSRFKATEKLSPLDLATQVYEERLTLKLIESLTEND